MSKKRESFSDIDNFEIEIEHNQQLSIISKKLVMSQLYFIDIISNILVILGVTLDVQRIVKALKLI